MKKNKDHVKLKVREIEKRDLTNGFLLTLTNLSELGNIGSDLRRAEAVLSAIIANPLHKIFVAVDHDTLEIIGSTTLLIEQKFLHDGSKAGHIEDVVTRKGYQGLGVGSALIGHALWFAKMAGCYKVILDCSEANIGFYQKAGFRVHETSMRYDLH
jgi:glucosamine-phosphate N-acetyltransferase